MKKLVSMLLALSMVLSVFCMIPAPVAAFDPPVPEKPKENTSIDKTAAHHKGDQYDVTLTVPGTFEGAIDVVFILGGGMTANMETIRSAINVFKPAMESGKATVRMGLISLEKGKEIILDLNTPEAVLNPATYEQFVTEKFLSINDLPVGSTNLHSQLLEAQKMLAEETEAKPENKYVFVLATGRTYWFDDANGEQATIVGEVEKPVSKYSGQGKGIFYYYGNYHWQSLRGGHSSLYMIPATYGNSYENFYNAYAEWVKTDGDKYVYTPHFDVNDPAAYDTWQKANSKDWRDLYDYDPTYNNGKGGYPTSSARHGAVIISPKPTAENFTAGVVDGFTSASNHALNYERAQYECIQVWKELVAARYNCYSICSEAPNYQNGSENIKSKGYTGKSTIQVGHAFMDYLAKLAGHEKAPVVWEYQRDENGNVVFYPGKEGNYNFAYDTLIEDFFAPVRDHIIHTTGKGSYVKDVIGYEEGIGNFEFLTNPDLLRLVKNENGKTVTYAAKIVDSAEKQNPYVDVNGKPLSEGAKISYYFYNVKDKDENGKNPKTPVYWLDYFAAEEGKPGTEMFYWTFGETVTKEAPVSLTYRLELKDKSTTIGEYKIHTNIEAILYPKDSEGEWRVPELFPRPDITYKVENKTEIAIVLAVLPHLVANNLGEGQDHTQNALYNLLAPVMNSGLYDVRLGLITVEMQQQVLLDARSPESLLPENEADWVKMLNDILVPAKNLYVGPTGVENNINRAYEMLVEDEINGELVPSLPHIANENKFFYLVATGRSYWFENDEGQALTIATKAAANGKTYALWNERTWKIARNNNSNVYPVPIHYGTDANAYEKYFKEFSQWAINDEYKYAYIVNCGSENGTEFMDWYAQNRTELNSGGRFANIIADPNSDSGLYGSGFLYYDPAVGFDINVLPNGAHNAMCWEKDKVDMANLQHALNYEVGQYEAYLAWMKMLEAGCNCISVCSEDVRYQNYSRYLQEGAWKYSSPQIGHSFMDYLAKQNGTQECATLVYEFSDDTSTSYSKYANVEGKYWNVMTNNFFPAVVDSEKALLDYHLNKNTTPALAVEPRPRLLFANPPKAQSAPVITEQPAVTDIAAKNNEIINASIQATGKEISYEWFFVDANGNEISTGFKNNMYIGQMKPEYDKLALKCKVTDKNGKSVESNAIRLSYVPTELKILAQSEAIIVADNNEYALAYVNAQGEGLTYVWYVKERGSAGWNISSLNSPVYAAKMSPAVSGRQVKCVIFDKFNGFVESQTITLTCSAPVSAPSVSKELKITNVLPEAITVAKKATATVTIEAQGEGLTYTWYFQNDGANNWFKASETGNTYSLAMTAGRSGRKVYCEVTDINGNMVKSAVVTLLMEGAK